jgi:hypothetical protein
MNVSSHLGIILLVIVGMVVIFGVIVIAAIETRRKEKGQPSIISGKSQSDKAEEES